MSTILDTIAEATKERVRIAKQTLPTEDIRRAAFELAEQEDFDGKVFPFEAALRKEGISLICECKKASPSKGIIAEVFPYLQIAKEYEKAGASAISVLTEPQWFLGDLSYLSEISRKVSIPCLRKDFTVDEYMIYEAKISGASAVLLICSILDLPSLKRYHALCDQLHLSALVEAHDENEVDMAIAAGARIIGVNNRDLKNFQVDPSNCLRLREKIPSDIVFVAESGVHSREDVVVLEKEKVDAILIGEAIMKSPDKSAFVAEILGK